jgi:hypothetical protein
VWGFGSSAKLCFVVLGGSLGIVGPFVQTTDLQTPQHSMPLVGAPQSANSLQTDIAHIIRELNEIESQSHWGKAKRAFVKKVVGDINCTDITQQFILQYKEVFASLLENVGEVRNTTSAVTQLLGFETKVNIYRSHPAVIEAWRSLLPQMSQVLVLANQVYCTTLFHITTKAISGVGDGAMQLSRGAGDLATLSRSITQPCGAHRKRLSMMLEEPRRAYDFPLLRKDNTKLDAGGSFVTGYLGPGALLHAEALLKPCHLSSHSTAGVAQTQCKMATIDTTYFHYAKSAQDVDFLQSVSFLSESPRFKVAQFASMIETRTLEPQEHLVSCGELANQSVYIVKSGQLKLTVTLQVLLRPALLHVAFVNQASDAY